MSENTQVAGKKKKSGKLIISVFTVLLVMMLSYVVSVAYNIFVSDKIYDGVVVDGIDATGMTKQELLEILNKKYNVDLASKNLHINSKSFSEVINFEKAKLKYDINSSVDKAYNFGRDGNFINKFLNLSMAKTSSTHININYSYDKEYIRSVISSLSKKTFVAVKEYEIIVTPPSKVFLVTGHAGESIKEDELLSAIEESFRKFRDGKIDAKVVALPQKEITVDALYNKVSTEAKDASFEVIHNKLNILPHVAGRHVEKSTLNTVVDAAKFKNDSVFPLQVTLTDPKLKTADIESNIFRDDLASYSTQFYTGDKNNDNRKENITIASKKINGTIIAPDKNFSFNDVVGARTPENGYKDAHAYIGGKIVDSTGGGICQVSTTLYNASLFADVEIVERHNHMFTVGYVPKGRDAAVAYGSADFVFKNNTRWPIKVICWVSPDNKVYFSLKGTNEHPDKSVEYRQEMLAEIPPSVENTNDPTMDEGTTEVTNEGMLGYMVDTFKILKQNGKVISETKLHTSRYEPYPKQVKVGTKKPQAVAVQLIPASPSPQPSKTKGTDDSYNPPVTVR